MKTKFVFATVILTAAVLSKSCSDGGAKDLNTPTRFELNDSSMERIELADVQYLNLADEVRLTGKIIPDENNMVQIFPMVGGQVTYVDAELGDLVSTSKALAVIKSGEVAEYEREKINAEAEFQLAKKNLEIEEELYASNFSSEREVRNARIAFDEAKAELEKIEEILRVYSINSKGEHVVKSPVAGFIIEKKIGPGLQIRPDMIESIFTVARLDEVFVSMNIYESDIAKIHVGMEVEIHVFSYEDTVYTGTIERIINVLDPESKTMEARVRLKNPGFKLKPDMNCAIHINFTEEQKMLTVPSTAVVFDKSKTFVMIYRAQDDIETREVVVERDINGVAYIASGLENGEKVISKNALFIYDSMND